MDIPPNLLTEYQHGRVLIFIGQGINGDEWTRLGSLFAKALQDESLLDLSTSELAEEYEDAYGRQSLIQTVLDFYQTSNQIYPVYQHLVSLDKSTLFVTTCFDERLEHVFTESGGKLNVLVTQIDRSYGGTPYESRLYKLHGTLTQPETLKLTAEDLQELYYQQGGLSTALKGHLAEKTILFVGFALDEPFFQQLYRGSIKLLDRHVRQAYALGGPYSRQVERFCDRNQIALIGNDPADFFIDFIEALEEEPITVPFLKKLGSHPVSPPNRPYKRLLSYTPDDASLFFGRRHEIEHLLSLIQANRLVILHGPSGIGKSSLLGAGITPYLTEHEYTAILVKTEGREPPEPLIRQQIVHHLPETASLDEKLPLPEYLTEVCTFLQTPLVIILDQFEDFFIHHTSATRSRFTVELAQILLQRSLPVKWVLAVRAEWFSALGEMEEVIRDIFKTRFRLGPLNLSEARKVIERPLKNVGMSIEPELVTRLLQDLGPQEIKLPQLQLVCDTLYNTARNEDNNQLLLAQYEALGGTEGILTNYLTDFLRRYPPEQANRIRKLLQIFVTSENTVFSLTAAELEEQTNLAQEYLLPLLHELENERLVSSIEKGIGQPYAYQLAHSYLAATLADDPEIRRQKAIRELLDQETRDWQKIQSLMSHEKLAFLRDQLGDIELSEEARELIFRSAIQNDEDIEFWIKKVDSADICAQVITEHLTPGQLADPRPLAALSAISYLSDKEQFKSLLAELAFDPSVEADVRRETAVNLECLDRGYFIHSIELVLETSPGRKPIVVEAINSAQDTGVEIATSSRLSRFKLKWPLRWFRLKLNRARRNTIMLFSSLGGATGSAIGGFAGGIYSAVFMGSIFAEMPEKFFFATVLAAVSGLVIGLGIGFGLGTVEAMGERRLSGFYISGIVFGAVIPAMLFGAADVDLYRALLGAVAGFISGSFTGSSLAIVISLTRNIFPFTRRLVVRIMLGMIVGVILGIVFGFATHHGLASTRNAEGAVVPVGAPYGFGFGFLIPPFIAAGIELAERRLAKTLS